MNGKGSCPCSSVHRQDHRLGERRGTETKSWEPRRAVAARRNCGFCAPFGAVFSHTDIDGAQAMTIAHYLKRRQYCFRKVLCSKLTLSQDARVDLRRQFQVLVRKGMGSNPIFDNTFLFFKPSIDDFESHFLQQFF